jgi:hypothetical protein
MLSIAPGFLSIDKIESSHKLQNINIFDNLFLSDAFRQLF